MAVVGDFPFVRSRKVVLIKVWCLYGFRRVWRFHSVTVVSVSVSALVALSLPESELSGGPAVALWRCHSLPEIDELIVGLLPVCLCPGRRCPGYGWESQLWHPPWGYYCSRPAGGPGGCWPPEQPWPTYCCHTPGDTVARAPTRGSDWLRQNDSAVESSNSTGKLPDCAKPLLMAAVRRTKRERWHRSTSFPPVWSALSMPVATSARPVVQLGKGIVSVLFGKTYMMFSIKLWREKALKSFSM